MMKPKQRRLLTILVALCVLTLFALGALALEGDAPEILTGGPLAFDQRAPADIEVPIALNGAELTAVKNGDAELLKDSDYTLVDTLKDFPDVSGVTVTLKQSYLSTLAISDHTLTFHFGDEIVKEIALQVTDSTVKVDGISFLTEAPHMKVGETLTLSVALSPDNATDQSVTWASLAPGTVSVSESGVITAMAHGSAEITATSADGGFSAKLTVTVGLGAPSIQDAATKTRSISVSFAPVEGATGYAIYRSRSGGAYQLLGNAVKTPYVDTTVSSGGLYSYRIRAYRDYNGISHYGEYSAPMAVLALDAPRAPSVTLKNDCRDAYVSWSRVRNVTGYTVYRAESPNGPYQRVASTTRTYYWDRGIPAGKVYYYRIAAYKEYQKVAYYTAKSGYKICVPVEKSAVGGVAGLSDRQGCLISWTKKDSGITGYNVYRATSSRGSYKRIASANGITSFRDTGIRTGRQYYYKIRAYKKINNVTYYGPYSDAYRFILLSTPTGCSASILNSGLLRLAWKSVYGATGYKIYRSTDASSGFAAIGKSSQNAYTDAGAEAGVPYYYKVSAYRTLYGIEHESGISATVRGMRLDTPAFTSLVAALDGTAPELTWNAVSGDPTGYNIYRSTSEFGTYTYLKSIAPGTTFTDSPVDVGKTYFYKVCAYKQVGGNLYYSGYSGAYGFLRMPGMSAVSVSSKCAKSITLKWGAVGGADTYAVYRADAPDGDYKHIGTARELSYTDRTVLPCTPYYYKVKAYRILNGTTYQSNLSEPLSAIAFDRAEITSVEPVSATSIRITWKPLSGDPSGYEIYRATSKRGTYTYLDTVEGANTYLDETAQEGRTYYYKIRPYKHLGGALKAAGAGLLSGGTYFDDYSLPCAGIAIAGGKYAIFYQGDAKWPYPTSVKRTGCIMVSCCIAINNMGVKNTPYEFYVANGRTTPINFTRLKTAFHVEPAPALDSGSSYLAKYSGGYTYVKDPAKNGIAAVKEAIDNHPEGVVVYFSGRGAHAVVACKYVGDTIYYADPGRTRTTLLEFKNTWVAYSHKMTYRHIKYIIAFDHMGG